MRALREGFWRALRAISTGRGGEDGNPASRISRDGRGRRDSSMIHRPREPPRFRPCGSRKNQDPEGK